MRNIIIGKSDYLPIEEKEVEIVERKRMGMGHPDTICDLVCESVSQALSQYHLKRFGKVLHHNLNKGLLVAGRSQPEFGGGKILEKIKIIIAGMGELLDAKQKDWVMAKLKNEIIFQLKLKLENEK